MPPCAPPVRRAFPSGGNVEITNRPSSANAWTVTIAAAALLAVTMGQRSALGLFAYLTGSATYAKYLLIPHIPGAGELLIFCGAMAGAGLAFLWFNAYPAQVFMGDTGSLAIGGIIAALAIIVRKELLIPIFCMIFFIELLSVMIQVGYFKYTRKKYGEGRRILLMSPLHHHYQK